MPLPLPSQAASSARFERGPGTGPRSRCPAAGGSHAGAEGDFGSEWLADLNWTARRVWSDYASDPRPTLGVVDFKLQGLCALLVLLLSNLDGTYQMFSISCKFEAFAKCLLRGLQY